MNPAALICIQAVLEVSGVVLGPNGKPLAKARVEAGSRSVLTDAKGRFGITLPEGVNTVRIAAPEMEPQTRAVVAGSPLFVQLEPAVKEAVVEVVEGSAYGSEGTPATAITRLDIYTTPGAAADVFQAAKALPGVSNATEGAELFVRGGKPDEVGIYLNGGRLAHPFHHPSTQGGIFTAVDTAMVSVLNFIPGGFSARYGDALSAVLDLSVDGAPVARSGVAVFNMASQGIQHNEPLAGGLARVSMRYSNTLLLDKLFHLSRNFQEAPISTDANLAFQTDVGKGGRLSVLGLGSVDHLAVDTRVANREDTYRNRSRTSFLSVQHGQVLSDAWVSQVVVSRSSHQSDWSFGPWGMDTQETNTFHRVEATWSPSADVAFEGGLDGEKVELSPRGAVPYDLANWGSSAAARRFAYDFDGSRQGLYSTVRTRWADRFGLSLGGRTDRYSLMQERTWDLRATLSYQIAKRVVLRLAGGSFHQAPPLKALDPYAGNPALKPLRATHLLAALDAGDDAANLPWQVRVEVFRKAYDRLLVEDPALRYVGSGEGRAQGVDLLVKLRKGDWRAWVGYGYLDTRRREDKQFVLGPVPTSVPHNLTGVWNYSLMEGREISFSYRYASGAPLTPILGGLSDGQGGFVPLEGARYSERLPAYHRVDARYTHLFTRSTWRCAAFVEVMNLLGRRNLSGYSYSADFSRREGEPSYFSRRILVAGLTVMW